MSARVITPDLLAELPLPRWSDDADKEDYGKLLVIAGSVSLPGAAILVAEAALRVGCGTVRAAVPAGIAPAVGAAVPELMLLPLPETHSGTLAFSALAALEAQYEACDAALIGPGLGAHEDTDRLACEIVRRAPLPLIVDAQALTALAGQPALLEEGSASAPRLATPHGGEMSRLQETNEEAIETEREQVAARFAAQYRTVLVLKGRETLIASPAGALYRNCAGTRGMGRAGSGDVLAGICGGLLTQGLDATAAAVWAVYLHALAGEAAARRLGDDGMLARDIVAALPEALYRLKSSGQATS